jgi:hypothetical protein
MLNLSSRTQYFKLRIHLLSSREIIFPWRLHYVTFSTELHADVIFIPNISGKMKAAAPATRPLRQRETYRPIASRVTHATSRPRWSPDTRGRNQVSMAWGSDDERFAFSIASNNELAENGFIRNAYAAGCAPGRLAVIARYEYDWERNLIVSSRASFNPGFTAQVNVHDHAIPSLTVAFC